MIDLKQADHVWQRDFPVVVQWIQSILAVTPWGDLYPCHQFVGEDEDFLIGNVFDGITTYRYL